MTMSKLWVPLAACIGAGAALATTAAVQDTGEAGRQVASTRADGASQPTQAARSVELEVAPGRLEALERAVAGLRGARARQGEDAPAEPPSPEEERARVAARFTELERRLLAEPVDGSWSGGATESLRNDLSAIAVRDGFDLVAVECRTETCRAALRWPSYEAAVKTGMHLPERAVPGLNCAASIWLEEPDSPAGSYSSNLFLDCSEQRAGPVDAVQ